MSALVVVQLAGTALFQDRGRAHRAVGVPGSGAFDRRAHAAATRLVGGHPGQASLEVVGTLRLVAEQPVTVAVTGCARVELDGRPAPWGTALLMPAGAVLWVVAPRRGTLAVAGGFCPEPVLGSRATCLLGPIGPPPVRTGDRLALAPECASPTVGDFVLPDRPRGPVRVVPGPHGSPWATGPAGSASVTVVTVLAASRIGVRVRPVVGWPPGAGAPDPDVRADRRGGTELASFGVLPGAIQRFPDGDWVVLGPDCGTMGGYPVVGVVASADLDRWAHVLPGDEVALVPVSADAPPSAPAPRIVHVAGIPG